MSTLNLTRDYGAALAQKIADTRAQILNPVARYLDAGTNLPPAPTLVTELLTLFREPDRDIDQVVQLISYEPSLTAQILRRCNSASFAGEQPPGDIFEAVSRMGFYQVYCLVVSIFGAKTKSMEGANEGVDVQQLWRHSVAVAVAASIVADDAGEAKAAAFTAGLLHDIGKLVLASAERERYSALIQSAKDRGAMLSTVERSVLGIDHAQLGGELMRRWNLPPDVVAAVRFHHDPESAVEFRNLIATVQAGDTIAHQLSADDLSQTDVFASSTNALDVLGLNTDDLPRLLAKTHAELEKVKGMLEG